MKYRTLLWAVLVLWSAVVVRASDFDGTWKGKVATVVRPGGERSEYKNEYEMVFNLKVEGDKLTGTIEAPFGKLTIEDGKVSGNEISFNTSQGDKKVTHTGKLADGKLAISVETPSGKRGYTLSRVVELAGQWKGNFAGPDGNNVDLLFNFKVDGDKLTGTVDGPAGAVDIVSGKIEGEDFSFDTVVGDSTIGHKGKTAADEITLHCSGFGNEWDLVIKRAEQK